MEDLITQAATASLRTALQTVGDDASNVPICDIDPDPLLSSIKDLLALRLSIVDIARRLQISTRTVYRKIRENRLTYRRFCDISDQDLRTAIRAIKQRHLQAGEVYLIGHLRALKIYVPRSRVREILYDVDQSGISSRQTHAIHRRVYYAPCPNFVWHLDGLHKLVRWKFVVHGAIDGFSRMIVFLSCSNNNRANTVLIQFENAVEKYGWPLHVRTDHGGENADVWHIMVQHHNTESAVIVGSSVHNERVERMWRDVNRIVSSQFRTIFYQLETQGILNPLNEADLFCVHWVFSDLINQALTEHAEAHNHHSISTEGHYTPTQLHFANQHLTELHYQQPMSATSAVGLPNQVRHGDITVGSVHFQAPALLLQGLRQEVPHEDVTVLNSTEMYRKAVNYVSAYLLDAQNG